jgi:hypothetical protein
MNNVTLTVCDMVGPCEECGRVRKRTYRFFVYGYDILLCGQCIEMFVAQLTSVLQREEPRVAASIPLNAENASELRCSRCLDMLAAHLTVYRRRGEGQ